MTANATEYTNIPSAILQFPVFNVKKKIHPLPPSTKQLDFIFPHFLLEHLMHDCLLIYVCILFIALSFTYASLTYHYN